MADIKVKQSKKGTIKTINKAVVGTEKMKDRLVQAKDKTKETYQEETSNNGTEYAINKISKTASNLPNNVYRLNKYGKKNFDKTVQNIQNVNQKMKTIKKKNHAKKVVKQMKNATKTTKKGIKTADRTVKTTKQVAKTTAKATKRAIQMAKATAKATVKAIKVGIKATIAAIKAIIVATKALIAFLVAGGWIVVLIIIVVCLIAMLVSSIFGIFFSSEDTGSTITVNGQQQVVTMNQVIADLNTEFMNKITQIQKDNPYDEYDINSHRAEWKDVLAIYTVKLSNGNNEADVITLNDEKVNLLKEIFWEMNEISFTKDEESHEEIRIGLTSTDRVTVTKVKLHITITGKSANEMADKYNFSQEQRKQLQELTDNKYANMWASVIYGSSVGSNDIVLVAASQIGNVGGQPYWSWYGFDSRVEWCACFVSWCANECGYIEAGLIPKFAGCQSEGVDWFRTCGLWKEKGFSPKPGDIIFFDWADKETGVRNGQADHVGIVEKTENGRVYTIEGNSSDSCCRRDYNINSLDILGYGTPMY